MKTFVQKKIPAPIKRSSFQNYQKSKTKKKWNRKIIGFFLLWVIILGSLSFWIYLLIQNLIFKPSNIISEIIIADETQNHYHNPLLKKTLEQELLKKNSIIATRFGKSTLTTKMKESFPFIEKLNIVAKTPSSILVTIIFWEPEIIFLQKDKKLGAVKWKIFTIFSGDIRWENAIKIYLPDYWNNTNLSGIFHKIDHQTLLNQITLIQEKIPWIQQIIYIPGWNKIIVKTSIMSIYLDNNKSISDQIEKLLLLQQNYRDFPKIKEIDLSSLDTPIIKKPKIEPEIKTEKSQ